MVAMEEKLENPDQMIDFQTEYIRASSNVRLSKNRF